MAFDDKNILNNKLSPLIEGQVPADICRRAISAANLTSIPGANITGTIPSAALSNVD